MHPLVASKLPELQAICRRYSVRRLELFGSAAAGGADGSGFDPVRSDLDFLVEFLPVPRHGLKDVYFQLLFALEDLCGRPIDLVEVTAVRNPYFRASVEATRVPVYAAA